MKVYVGFSSSNLIGSKFIAEVEKRKYSHAYLRFTDVTTNDQLVTQAGHGMVHEILFEHFKSVNTVQEEIEFDLTTEQYKSLLKVNNHYKGSKYSILQLIFIGIKILFKKDYKVNKRKEFICSEWVYTLLVESGVIQDTVKNPDTLTPSDLNKLLKGQANG